MERLVQKLTPGDLHVMANKQLFSQMSFNARENHCLFVNGKGRRFIEAGYPLGVDVNQEGRGVAQDAAEALTSAARQHHPPSRCATA